mmetsp:Transcript_32921/g.39851  ORF Transcript_32921/g.39851 Transcript_32921/m.39851 type:complete len:211 (-) Transcript_32921:178-810(-)
MSSSMSSSAPGPTATSSHTRPHPLTHLPLLLPHDFASARTTTWDGYPLTSTATWHDSVSASPSTWQNYRSASAANWNDRPSAAAPDWHHSMPAQANIVDSSANQPSPPLDLLPQLSFLLTDPHPSTSSAQFPHDAAPESTHTWGPPNHPLEQPLDRTGVFPSGPSDNLPDSLAIGQSEDDMMQMLLPPDFPIPVTNHFSATNRNLQGAPL